jgi:hypothetical protein
MIPAQPPSTTHVLQPPPGQEDIINPLPVTVEDKGDGLFQVWAYFKPSAEELAALNRGSAVALCVLCTPQSFPPVSIDVTKEPL